MTSDRSGRRPLRRLMALLRPHRSAFLSAVAATVVGQVATVGTAVATAWLAGQVLAGRAVAGLDLDGPARWVLLALAVGVTVVAVATWWEMLVAHDLAYRVLADLRVVVYDRLRRIVPARDRPERSGDLATTAMTDVESLEWLYAHVIAQTIGAGMVLVGGSAALAAIRPDLLLVLLPAALLVLTVPWWWKRTADRQGEELRTRGAALGADVVDLLQGLPELTAAGALDRRRAELGAATAKLTALSRRTAGRAGREVAATDLLVSLAGAGALLIIALDPAGVPPQWVPVVLVLTGTVLAPAAAVAGTLQQAGSLRAAVSRILDVLDTPDTVPAAPATVARTPVSRPGEPVVTLTGVRFGYRPGRPVLDGIDLRVHRGETVALVGRSGGGKSTVVALLQRFFDPDAGRIDLLGTDLRAVPDEQLRRRVAVVGQDVQIFAGTLRENVGLAVPDAPDAALRSALTTARAVDLLDRPGRWGAVIGERGARLSGGERARLAVARALAVGADLLVLDEAVANLDAHTERALHEALAVGAADRATVVVAHRPSAILRADRVVVLDSGRVVADGPPGALLAAGGPLADLLTVGDQDDRSDR
ncbi:ABC transporter ATP-binding protein [Nakamurella flava]|uniref:ABC transporter ATP-binding protein n=1 Tax=Nakamurella flava TaxID=2576308 RepID=A0A4U6QG02_9ACTN|nr:ABC transporter ATP-binding protein [Nakamurella flava]TKV59214.1 ABC transporter ATP-binding protein [Nakamurella flava]